MGKAGRPCKAHRIRSELRQQLLTLDVDMGRLSRFIAGRRTAAARIAGRSVTYAYFTILVALLVLRHDGDRPRART
jgi:hypothetical protein